MWLKRCLFNPLLALICGSILCSCVSVTPSENNIAIAVNPENPELIPIQEGATPAFVIAGIIEQSGVNTQDSGNPAAKILRSGKDIDILLAAVKDRLAATSGTRVEVDPRLADGSIFENLTACGEPGCLPTLSEQIEDKALRSRLIEHGFTHVVALIGHIERGKSKTETGAIGGYGAAMIVFATSHDYLFVVNAVVYDLNDGVARTHLQLHEKANDATVWTPIAIPIFSSSVDVDQFLGALGNKTGDEIGRRFKFIPKSAK